MRSFPIALTIAVLTASAGAPSAQEPSAAAAVEEALSALRAGDAATARARLEALVAADPAHGPALFHLGRLALEEGRIEEAAGSLEAAIAADPPRAYAAWHLLGRVRLRQQRPADAWRCFEQAVARAPRFAPARLGLAEAALMLGRRQEAEQVLEALTSRPEPPPRALLLVAELALHDGDLGEARAALERVRRAADASPVEQRTAELLLVATGEPQQAVRRLTLALDADLGFAPAYRALALARARAAGEGAQALYRVARELDDTDALAILFLAADEGAPPLAPLHDDAPRVAAVFQDWERGRREDAARAAEELLALRPLHVPLLLLRIRRAEESGELWSALAGYQELVGRLGDLPSVQSLRARVAQTLGAHDLAACAARSALGWRPDDGELWYLLAAAEEGRGEGAAALAAYDRALELGFAPARVELRRGDLLFEQMRIDEALAAYRRAVELDPEAAEAIRPFALASLTADQQRTLRELLERHVAAHPDNADTLYALGQINLRDGDLATAERHLRRLAEVAAGHAQVHYSLGQLLLRRGAAEEGRAEMARFAELKAAEDADWERHNRAHFRRLQAEEARAAGRRAEAVRLWEENVADLTATAADLAALADAYLETGRAADAQVLYRRILAAAPSDREALRGWARAAGVLERGDEAAEARRRLELLQPATDC